jgi:excinuclease UvrABC nuclease subunit
MMATAGVYVFKRSGRVVYVGRGDKDVDRRESASYGQAEYDLATTIYRRSSPRQAYLTECRLYHRHQPIDNEIHPRRPGGSKLAMSRQGLPSFVKHENR